MEQDSAPLEKHREVFKICDLWSKCNKGHLQFYGKRRSMILGRPYIFGVTTVVRSLAIKDWIL